MKIQQEGRIEIIGIDEEHPGLAVIKIPLNTTPDRDWINCFNNPGRVSYGIIKPRVVGNTLVWRADKDRIKEDIHWVFSYIDQANKCYEQILKQREKERKQIEQARKAKDAELKGIQEELDNL